MKISIHLQINHLLQGLFLPKIIDQGFTLLEVMISIAILAVVLTEILNLQSRGLSFAHETKSKITISLLAKKKMAEVKAADPEDIVSDSGDFGENYPDYSWQLDVEEATSDLGIDDLEELKQISLTVLWEGFQEDQYSQRIYRFVPQKK